MYAYVYVVYVFMYVYVNEYMYVSAYGRVSAQSREGWGVGLADWGCEIPTVQEHDSC